MHDAVTDPPAAADGLAAAEAPTAASLPITIGIDMGGTFVDCVAAGPGGAIAEAKAPTTRDDPVRGIVAALEAVAGAAGRSLEGLLGATGAIVHGTTLGVNTLLERSGGRVGLLATRGHEDAILIGRVHQKVAGLRPHELTRVADLRKPPPLVPRWDIVGIDERVDASGAVVVALDEEAVVAAADRLVASGCEALAVAFLWSHLRPDHERRAAELIAVAHPALPVVCSSAVAPVLGEYERTATAVVDAMLRARLSSYVERLRGTLAGSGFAGRLWLMGTTGGVIPADTAIGRPVDTLRSGPVGGIVAAGRLAAAEARPAVITADMGGTSFDVGLLADGAPQESDVSIVGQYHLATPAIAVQSIGAGGGSVAWLDELGGLHVGPRSAGAVPGPACYGRGGTEPTVTDADVVLGRIDADAVLGGQIRLDVDAARRAVAGLAERLEVGVAEAAAGIVRVADSQMADLIRTVTLERGHDPRAMTLIAYGGAGPVHAGRVAADVGVREAIVPRAASVFSALGLATADYRRTYRRSRRLRLPLDPDAVGPIAIELRREAEADFAASGIGGRLELTPWFDVRYRRQTHQLRVPATFDAAGRIDVGAVGGAFEAQYARTYGAGTGYAEAGIEATAVGLHATATRLVTPNLAVTRRVAAAGPRAWPPERSRRVWFDGGWIDETPIVAALGLAPGTTLDGPAILDWGATSLVVHPGQRVVLDAAGNGRLQLGAAVAGR